MKCKACGAEISAGTKKCPQCGASVPIAGGASNEVFRWNVQDFPKPKKKTDISIDWSAGRIFDSDSGKIYHQSDSMWAEPEEVKDLFVFDRKNEEFQQVLDKQVDSITYEAPVKPVLEDGRVFNLPSSMDMKLFDDLIGDDVEVIIPGLYDKNDEPEKKTEEKIEMHDSDSEIDRNTAEAVEKEEQISVSKPAGEVRSVSELRVRREEKPQTQDESPKMTETGVLKTDSEDLEKKQSADNEDVVFKGLQKLMDAEQKFKQDMERVTYLSESEAEKAERVEKQSQKLKLVPTISFRTIEDEYKAYQDQAGISKADKGNNKTAEKKKDENNKKEENNKEVQIKINEPSGTKVTVKTQEISIASRENIENAKTKEVELEKLRSGPKNVQVSVEVNAAKGNASVEVTRRHDGATVVKTVDDGNNQEHLFVDAAAEKMSAETVADEKTDDTEIIQNNTAAADDKSLNVDDEVIDAKTIKVMETEPESKTQKIITDEAAVRNPADDADAEEETDTAEEVVDNSNFWDTSDRSNRMTITDIFGQEARDIINGVKSKSKHKNDMVDSIILDIDPKDIAITDDQTKAIHKPTQKNVLEETARIESEKLMAEEKKTAAVPEKTSIKTEADVTPAVKPVSDRTLVMDRVAYKKSDSKRARLIANSELSDYTLVIPTKEIKSAEQSKKEDSFDVPEFSSKIQEGAVTAGVSANVPETKIAESAEANVIIEKPEEISHDTCDDEELVQIAQTEKNGDAAEEKTDIDAENSANQSEEKTKKHRTLFFTRKIDNEERATLAENRKMKSEMQEDAKMGIITKILIWILIVVLIAEFSIFGIKLFAPESGAAVIIDRIEEQITSIIKGSNASGEGSDNADSGAGIMPADNAVQA